MANPVNRMLWLAMMNSVVIYVVVAAFVELPPNDEVVGVAWPALAGVAGAIAAGSIALRRRALVEPIRAGALDPRTPEGLARAQTPFLLGLVLSESVAIFGLVLSLLSGDLRWVLAFGAGALALLWLHRPTSPDLVPPLSGPGMAPPLP